MGSIKKFIFCVFIMGSGISVVAQAHEVQRRTLLTSEIPQNGNHVKVAFFDADSTLRIARSGKPSANGAHDYIILPLVAQAIQRLNARGFLVVIVSNQGGVPQFVSLADADAALYNMIQDLGALGARIDYYDFAENDDENRKPEIRMATRLEELLASKGLVLDKTKSFMVGDAAYKKASRGQPAETRPDGVSPGLNFSNSDRLFAEKYGIDFYEPQHFFGWSKYGVEVVQELSELDELQRAIGACEMSLSR